MIDSESRVRDRNYFFLLATVFIPIRNVKYEVENFRVEQKTDYEKLIIELQCDGSIAPKDALQEAARILIEHFMFFSK